MHAMRGVSAHSNGFQTCRAIHLLQMLLGSIDCPGGFRYKPPFPKSAPPPAKPAAQVGPMHALHGLPLGFPQAPEDLLLDIDGTPHRIDKAFSWEAPLAVHGLMHMVIHNAWAGDPYPIDTLFLYMANMAWNSAMNAPDAMRMMSDKDATGQYKIPHIIYADAFFSEMVAYADLVFPDTTYLERWDCISLLDRPISDPDAAGDAIRRPVIQPDRDVRPFQDVLLDLGARLKLPGMIDGHGKALYPGGLKDYMVWHERRPGIGMLSGWRGHEEDKQGMGEPNRRQLDRYIENGCFWRGEIPEKARFYRFANRDFFDWAIPRGFLDKPQQIVLQLYSEPLRKFQLAAEGHGTRQPPDHLRARVVQGFDPLPSWYPPFGAAADSEGYVLHAITQRPMHMYHSWGGQNAWLRQIQARNPALHRAQAGRAPRPRRRRLGVDRKPARPGEGRDQADGRREPGHGVDLERDRQARRRMESLGDRAGIHEGLPAQPRDLGIAAAAAGRASLCQYRSGDGAGGVVRSQGAPEEVRAGGGGRNRAELRSA